jgi:hypothetical protein
MKTSPFKKSLHIVTFPDRPGFWWVSGSSIGDFLASSFLMERDPDEGDPDEIVACPHEEGGMCDYFLSQEDLPKDTKFLYLGEEFPIP